MNCTRPLRARGLCSAHWRRWSLGKPMEPPIRSHRYGCSVQGCSNVHYGNGLCALHNNRLRRNGVIGAIMPQGAQNMSTRERFWLRVTKDGPLFNGTPCWIWTGSQRDGYGRLRINGQLYPAHRFSYELMHGNIPLGLVPDHLCRNPPCVNPDHLEAVTRRENVLRGVSKIAQQAKTTHCPQGHPYDEANTIYYRTSRRCRICKNNGNRLYRQVVKVH